LKVTSISKTPPKKKHWNTTRKWHNFSSYCIMVPEASAQEGAIHFRTWSLVLYKDIAASLSSLLSMSSPGSKSKSLFWEDRKISYSNLQFKLLFSHKIYSRNYEW